MPKVVQNIFMSHLFDGKNLREPNHEILKIHDDNDCVELRPSAKNNPWKVKPTLGGHVGHVSTL